MIIIRIKVSTLKKVLIYLGVRKLREVLFLIGFYGHKKFLRNPVFYRN